MGNLVTHFTFFSLGFRFSRSILPNRRLKRIKSSQIKVLRSVFELDFYAFNQTINRKWLSGKTVFLAASTTADSASFPTSSLVTPSEKMPRLSAKAVVFSVEFFPCLDYHSSSSAPFIAVKP